jgi:hypothetical protein
MKKTPGDKWAAMRNNHLATYPDCYVCGSSKRVHVHHLRYRGQRGESEIPGDLMTLCAYHHNDLHGHFTGKWSELASFTMEYIRTVEPYLKIPEHIDLS